MQRNAVIIIVGCLLLCLTFNYTFPLHRDKSKWFFLGSDNYSQLCDASAHHEKIGERTKKMANNIEIALRKIKDSTQDIGKNFYDHLNSQLKNDKNILNEEDLRQYEQLVIMKKYPYLDLKELELQLSPISNKNIRQSVEPESLHSNFGSDPGICEDEGLNVEIINRGLSGFAIPPKIIKTVSMVEDKHKLNVKDAGDISDAAKLSKKSPGHIMMDSLKTDIKQYEENMIRK